MKCINCSFVKGWVDKKVLLVGFAETATALAQSLMFYALCYKEEFPLNIVGYTQTTRENVAENDFINISFERNTLMQRHKSFILIRTWIMMLFFL